MATDQGHSKPTPNPQGRPQRQVDPSGVRTDRRVIKRVSDAEFRKNMKMIGTLCRITALTAFTFAGCLLAHSIFRSSLELSKSILYATVFVVEGACFHLVARAVVSYLANESVSRLSKFAERLKLLMVITCALAITFLVVQIINWV